MFGSVVGIGATLPAFVLALEGADTRRRAVRLHVAVAGLLAAWYAAAVILSPGTYSVLRPSVAVYVVLAVVGSIAALGSVAVKNRHTLHGQQARIILFGVLVGTLPFVAFSFAPELLGRGAVAPARLTALAAAFIPASAAFAVAHSQFLGIRRLIHRGMVYALTTTVLLVTVVLLASVVAPALESRPTPQGTNLLIGAAVAVGVGLFYPLRLGIRRLVDRFLYEDIVDPQRLIETLRDDVVASTRADDFEAWIDRLPGALRVESVLLFGAASGAGRRLLAAAGPRASDVLGSLGPELEQLGGRTDGRDLFELRWGAEVLLAAPLRVEARDIGHLILGPKERGEVFVAAEKQLVGAVAPVLALALHKSELSDELRLVNQRLVDAEEAERARLASDVHDGPLQKAILLGGPVASSMDREGLARELVRDLREVCSRLRPAILDDLGLVPALEWLLEDAAKRFHVVPRLELRGVGESDRFPGNTELALFRITQEAISNAIRHGRPTAIDVSLIGEQQTLILRVDDDGVGFVAGPARPGGLGIPGIHGRAGRLGGTVDIRSAPGLGTSVVVRVPHPPRPLERP
jgi:signal transduction histidine kinase